MAEREKGTLLPLGLDAVVLECEDTARLAAFYIRLLGWEKYSEEGDEWVDIAPPGGGVKLAFQKCADYRPPVWPNRPGAQQQMAHLDIPVKDQTQMKEAVAHALACGATLAETQYDEEKWTSLIDPAGHPFCFVIWEK